MPGGHHERAHILQRRIGGTLLVIQALGDPVQQHLAVVGVPKQRAVHAILVLLPVRGVQVTVQSQGGRWAVGGEVTDLKELLRNAFGR